MSALRPNEILLKGDWVVTAEGMRADATAVRIEQLIAEHLVRVADSVDGWTTLFQDPTDDRFWELSYPQGELHGGGPPQLAVVSEGDARSRYRL